MAFLYNLSISVMRAAFFMAQYFNPKARHVVYGQKNLLQEIKKAVHENQVPIFWIHCASLGEFEQGRPVLEKIKVEFPNHKILLTFFSPSGYEVRKNYTGADYIFYLPYDSPENTRQFISITKPVLAIFIKYEFWPNYFLELNRRHIPIISASSIFREGQVFFKFYGGFMRKSLQAVDHFFVQNQNSKLLLSTIGLDNVSVSGDTRFDRVFQITQNKQDDAIAKKFKGGKPCWVIGSCWPEDVAVLAPFINENFGQLKFIIAPHEISIKFINEIMQSLKGKAIRYSQPGTDIGQASVLIVDIVGLLSQLYRYGEYAFVGGGFGKGLHNILEAACYGLPVFFGNTNYKKFMEAVDLIKQGGAFAVSDFEDLKSRFESLNGKIENYQLACLASKNYVEMNLGATEKIVSYCKKLLAQHDGQSI